jgi:hypothetical protein
MTTENQTKEESIPEILMIETCNELGINFTSLAAKHRRTPGASGGDPIVAGTLRVLTFRHLSRSDRPCLAELQPTVDFRDGDLSWVQL